MSVLVTGGAGLFGRALRQVVEESGDTREWHWLSSKDGDLRDLKAVQALFEKHKPTAVVHLAARVGGLFANMAANLGFLEDNMAMNQNVIACCHEHKVQDAIFCLSTCVFPAAAELPLTEESIHLGPPHFSNEGYAYSKRMCEIQTRYYRKSFGYNWICLIPTNIYGPHDNFNLQNAHVIPALIHKCQLAKENGTVFTIAGTGTPKRQFIYSLDLGHIVMRLLNDAANAPQAVIACPDDGDEPTIKEVGMSIVEAVGFTGEVVFDTSKSDGIHKKTASNATLRAWLGPDWKFTPMSEGMGKAVTWFLENRESART